MISIERTAYPILNAERVISDKTLLENYTLTKFDIEHINNLVRNSKLRLHYALQLKTFQTLGYFIEVGQIPEIIVSHIQKQMPIAHNIQLPKINVKTLYRHRQSVRSYLKVIPWGLKGDNSARRVAIKAAYQSAQTSTIPADIINVVIEELRNHNSELPAFSTLCRLVRHVRFKVDSKIFQNVYLKLSQDNKIPILDDLIKVQEGDLHSKYQSIKQAPKSPKITDFRELLKVSLQLCLDYLTSWE